MAIFVALALGLALGAMQAHGASKTNASIRARARELQRRINKQMTQVQVEAMDAVRRRSSIGNMSIAESRLRFGFRNTGLSISERLASLAADMTVDTDAINFAEMSRLDALSAEKLDIARGAQASQTRTGEAAVGGFAQGFNIGLAFDTSFAQLKFAQSQSTAFDQFRGVMSGVGPLQLFNYPRTFQAVTTRLSSTRSGTDLKLDLASGIESFLSIGGDN